MLPSEKFRLADVILSFASLVLAGCGSTQPSSSSTPPAYLFNPGPSYGWVEEFGGTNFPSFPPNTILPPFQSLRSLATAPTNGIVEAGYTIGSFNGFSNPNQVAENLVVAYSAAGVQLWSQQFGTGGGDFLRGIAIDQSGNIYVAGTTLGALPGYTNSNAVLEGAIYKLDQNGRMLWQKQLTVDGAYTAVTAISVDPSGSVLISGTYSENAHPNSTDLYFMKLDGTAGATLWTVRLGSTASDYLTAAAVDESGNLYAAGQTSGAFPGTQSGPASNFLAKIDGVSGSVDWVHVPSDDGRPIVAVFGIAARNGEVVIGGASSTIGVSASFLADPTARAFASEYSEYDGSLKWAKSFATGLGDEITGVAFTSSNNILATGVTNGVFAQGFVQPTDDIFLLTLAQDGSSISAAQFGTGPVLNQSTDTGPQIASAGNGTIFIGGPVQSPYPGFSNPSGVSQMFIAQFSRYP